MHLLNHVEDVAVEFSAEDPTAVDVDNDPKIRKSRNCRVRQVVAVYREGSISRT